MGVVVVFTGDFTQPPHMAEMDILGCECGGFTYLIRVDGTAVCNSCGKVSKELHMARISATRLPEQDY